MAGRRWPTRGGSSSNLDSNTLDISQRAHRAHLQRPRGDDADPREHAQLSQGHRTTSRPVSPYTRAQAWVQNQQFVPTVTFGIDTNDPAQAVFSSANIAALGGGTPSAAQLSDARELYAVLTGRITAINGELRLE